MRSTIARIALLLILVLTPLFVVNRMNAQEVPGEVSALSAQDLHNLPVGVMLADDQLDLSLTVLCPVSLQIHAYAFGALLGVMLADDQLDLSLTVLCPGGASVDFNRSIESPLNGEPERPLNFRFTGGVGST